MEWISVKDRLPEEDEKKHGLEVLCHYVSHKTEKRTYKTVGFLRYYKGSFWYGHVGNVTKEVSHWMPKPNPPKK